MSKPKRKAPTARDKKRLQQEINSQCPFCRSTEVENFHFHHIDEDPGNSVFENLLMLCPMCHSKVTAGEITQDEVMLRKSIVAHISGSIQTSKLDAETLRELDKIQSSYHKASPIKKYKKIQKIGEYIKHANLELAEYIAQILESISNTTRSGMRKDLALTLHWETCSLLDPRFIDESMDQMVLLGHQCANIGFNIAYDAIVYLKAVSIAQYGYLTLKAVHSFGKNNNLPELITIANALLSELQVVIEDHADSCKANADLMHETFTKYMDETGMVLPVYPEEVMKIIELENIESNTEKLKISKIQILSSECDWSQIKNLDYQFDRTESKRPYPILDFSITNHTNKSRLFNGFNVKVYPLSNGLSGLPKPYELHPSKRFFVNIAKDSSINIESPLVVPPKMPLRVQIELFEKYLDEMYIPDGRFLLKFIFCFDENLKVATPKIRLNTETDNFNLPVRLLM